jgi:hypothetical protein
MSIERPQARADRHDSTSPDKHGQRPLPALDSWRRRRKGARPTVFI